MTEKINSEEIKEVQKATECEYDETMEELLLENNFTYKNIVELIHFEFCCETNITRKHIPISVESLSLYHKYDVGCIFTLPVSNDLCHIYAVPLSKNLLRKMIKLKAFL